MNVIQLADQLNAGINPADIDGYDAARADEVSSGVNEWVMGDDERAQVAAYPGGLVAMKFPSSPWRAFDWSQPNRAAAEANRAGASHGVNGQVWDNA